MPHFWLTTYESNKLSTAAHRLTLIPECLFSKFTLISPLKATYKDVNNQKINFVGQTNATLETNKETIELALLITRAQTAPLMGLDQMQRLKINLSSNNDAIQIHDMKLDNRERRIIKLQNKAKWHRSKNV